MATQLRSKLRRAPWCVLPVKIVLPLSLAFTGFLGRFDGTAAETTVEHEFSRERAVGFEPRSTMLRASDGVLYGTTMRGGNHDQGVIFKFSPDTKAYWVIHHFSLNKTDGRTPRGPLTEGKDGLLYGTTSIGGAAGLGTVFKVNKDGTSFTILYSFTGGSGDGRVPIAGVRQGKDSAWLGTTDEGGTHGSGTIYRVNPDGKGYRVLHHFGGQFRSDGAKPRGTLCQSSDGKWYGTTVAGGGYGFGTVFVLNDDGSGYRTLRAFAGVPQDGAEPFGGLIEATDGRLYGTTVLGGRGSQGTVFRLRKDGTGFEVLRALIGVGVEGRNSYAELLQGKDGTLYGTTLNGGDYAGGVVFQLALDGSDFKTLFAFSHNRPEGHRPYGGLTLGADGSLFGTTTSGSNGRVGVVFRIRPD